MGKTVTLEYEDGHKEQGTVISRRTMTSKRRNKGWYRLYFFTISIGKEIIQMHASRGPGQNFYQETNL